MLKPIFQSPSDRHYFFGYYDKSELDSSSTKLLALQVDFLDHVPDKNDRALLGYFDLTHPDKPFMSFATTATFNWQQGCMLQWLGPNYNDRVIYNDLRDGKFVSIILNLNSKEEKILSMPVYTVSADGKFALCIDHERHHFCRRGYSYDGVTMPDKNKKIVSGDGIWRINLESGNCQQIISLETMLSIHPLSNMKNATHYLEHLMLSPNGDRFIFLHRWKMEEGGIYDRLYTANEDGNDIYLLNDSGRVGHFCWQNNKSVLIYGGISNPLNRLRRYKKLVKYLFKPLLPLYHKCVADNSNLSKALTGDSYVLLQDHTQEKKRVALAISDEDGHPSFPANRDDVFITDIYPNPGPERGSFAKLIKFDLSTNTAENIAELESIPEYDDSPIRCDLHPKIAYDGKHVSVDTMDRGVRGIYLYAVF